MHCKTWSIHTGCMLLLLEINYLKLEHEYHSSLTEELTRYIVNTSMYMVSACALLLPDTHDLMCKLK